MKFVNLYCSFGSNSFITGKNHYSSIEEAKAKQQCPAGYVWIGVAEVRSW